MITSAPAQRNYSENRHWSDKFIPLIKNIVGPYMLKPSTLEQDQKQAADLVVLTGHNLTIACRVRRHVYLKKYPNQFTVRAKAKYARLTELDKIKMGWGDWMFYGHSNKPETDFLQWYLINLSAFREHLKANDAMIKGGQIPNGDGTELAWFDVTSFPLYPPILISSSDVCFNPELALFSPS